ncbi:MAG: DoxX family protein [Propionibacteriaceae bacterium]
MTLIRAVGRTMLASYFIASGIKAVRKPSLYVTEAEPVTDKIVPALKKYAPAQVASYIPEDTATLVRINGVVQVAGGAMLATGKGRRLGSWLLACSLVPATVARHPFWTETDSEAKSTERAAFLKNVSLLGGVIVAARDTEGQPGLRWRTAAGAAALGKSGKSATKSITKSAHSVGDSLSDGAEAAVAGGLALAGVVAKQTRGARKKAHKEAEKQAKKSSKKAPKLSKRVQKQRSKATKVAADQAEKARATAAKQAAIAAKKAKPLQKAAEKQAQAAAKKAKPFQQAAAKQAQSIGKDVAHRAADLRKSVEKTAGEVAKNIELGHN